MKLNPSPTTPAPETRASTWGRYNAGDSVKIRGVRGTFRIQHFDGNIVTVYGGPDGHGQFRAFTCDRITRKVKDR